MVHSARFAGSRNAPFRYEGVEFSESPLLQTAVRAAGSSAFSKSGARVCQVLSRHFATFAERSSDVVAGMTGSTKGRRRGWQATSSTTMTNRIGRAL